MKTKIFAALALTFISLKLAGVISISWFWLLTPLVVAVAFIVLFAVSFAFSEDDKG